jgi:hypothetical protein
MASLPNDSPFSFIANDANQLICWVLIVNWQGLDEKFYPVKVTRYLSENTLIRQFHSKVLRCPR